MFFPSQTPGSSQGLLVFPLSFLGSLAVQGLETLVTEQLFEHSDSHNIQKSGDYSPEEKSFWFFYLKEAISFQTNRPVLNKFLPSLRQGKM